MPDQDQKQDDIRPVPDELSAKRAEKARPEANPDEQRMQVGQRVAQVDEMIDAVAANVQMLINNIAQAIELQLEQAQEDYKSGDPNRIILAEELFAKVEKAMPQQWVDIANMNLRQGFANLRRALELDTRF